MIGVSEDVSKQLLIRNTKCRTRKNLPLLNVDGMDGPSTSITVFPPSLFARQTPAEMDAS